MKEQASIHNEAEWVLAYFHAKAEKWNALKSMAAQQAQYGHEAYASWQMHSWEELAEVQRRPFLLLHLLHYESLRVHHCICPKLMFFPPLCN